MLGEGPSLLGHSGCPHLCGESLSRSCTSLESWWGTQGIVGEKHLGVAPDLWDVYRNKCGTIER